MRVTVIVGMVPPANAPEGVTGIMLSDHLARLGCQVTLLTSREFAGKLPAAWHNPAVEFRPAVRDWTWAGLRSLRRELKRSRPDAIVLIYLGYLYRYHPMITYLPTICRGLKPRPRLLTEFSNTRGSEPRAITTRIGRYLAQRIAGGGGLEWRFGSLLRDSDQIAAYCHQHLELLSGYYPPVATRGHVIPATPALRMIQDPDGSVRRASHQRLGFTDDDFVAVYFGYVYPSKGLETLIEAVAIAARTLPRIRLLVIGDSPEAVSLRDPEYPKRIRGYPAKQGIAERVTWTGFLEDEIASSFLHGCDVCVLPFVHGVRLHNTTFIVGACHGLPIVSTRGESLEPDFKDRQNVLLCWASDPRALADAMLEVAGNEPLRQQLRAGAREFAAGPSSWDAVSRQTLALLAENSPAMTPSGGGREKLTWVPATGAAGQGAVH